jgi:transposase
MSEEDQVIEVKIRPRANSWLICSGCQRPGPGYDTLPARRFEFVPFWGFQVFFAYSMRRVDCSCCGIKVESVPWAQGKHHLSQSYKWFLARWAKRMSWIDVAKAFQTSWENVFRSVQMAVNWGRDHIDLKDVKAIGIDEIQWQKGHHYLTLVYQIDEGRKRLLWIGQHRKVKTLLRFFRWFGKNRSADLQFICTDMWKPYLKVIAKKAGQAVHVLDRFHIMSHMSKAIDEVRAKESRELKAKGYEPILKGSRWLLLKRPKNLTDKQEIQLKNLLQYNLKAVRSYLLKEQFQFFWDYISPTWAGRFMDKWCKATMRSRIEPMKKVAKMLRGHRELLMNWFRAKGQFSSGAVEGFNNKAKLTTRKAFGFRTFQAMEVALFHTLADLPEPEMTHRFC